MIPVELGAEAFCIVVALGASSGAASILLLRRWSDGAKLRASMNRIWAHLMEFQLFGDEPALILKAQRDLLRANGQMLRLLAIPSLILAVPFAALLVGVDTLFGRAPLRVGDATVVTIQGEGATRELRLEAPPGIQVETAAVHIPADRQASWRVRPASPVRGDLLINYTGRVFYKAISSRPGLQWLTERRFVSPFSKAGLNWIEIQYPPATVFRLHWLVWFSVASLMGAGLAALRARTGALLICFALAFSATVTPASAETVSPLFARGYTVLPQPREVTLKDNDFRFGSNWRVLIGSGVRAGSTAVEELKEKAATQSHGSIELEIRPGSVTPGPTQDVDRDAIAAQAYRLELAPARIRILANAEPGLFYGVQTLLQLRKSRDGEFWLPEGEIVDWPDLGLRQIYWDDAHHLETMPELKRAIRQAATFKINGFVIKLEGHFQYRSAPALVEPQALSPSELQELTGYGLRYHVQVIPYLDAPAHIAFILKHPEYARFRAFLQSNYEMCATNPNALKLLYGMFDDLLAANQGVKYFYLSTDEAYYSGLSGENGCQEAQRAKELGSVGKVLAEFVTQAAGYLQDHGRTVVFWGEFPLKPEDIAALPPYVINGETYGDRFDPIYKARGIRQMIYNATEGEEQLFPHYFLRPAGKRLHPLQEDFERVGDAVSKIFADPARKTADLRGLIIAGWGDMGLHPETFWLGYATITAAGWNPFSAGPREEMSAFYPLFYGGAVTGMNRVYQLMSSQAQIWSDTWDTVDSTARQPIWGNSESIFQPPHPAHDQSISLPAVPSTDLRYTGGWARENAPRLAMAAEALPENDELVGWIDANFQLASSNRHGLEVFLAIARLCRQNLEMLSGLEGIENSLVQADRAARLGDPGRALEHVDHALSEAMAIRRERNAVLRDATTTWYKSWLPRAEEANGRRFLHELDNVKDHLPDRTVDMSYLVYRELLLPFDRWYEQTGWARNQYARAHNLPVRSTQLDWKSLQ